MKLALPLLAVLLLASACQPTPPAPSGGAAGDMPAGYCDSPPANPEDLANWNELCAPHDRR